MAQLVPYPPTRSAPLVGMASTEWHRIRSWDLGGSDRLYWAERKGSTVIISGGAGLSRVGRLVPPASKQTVPCPAIGASERRTSVLR